MKILLSAGHGGTDSGSLGSDRGKEKDRTLDLANRVASILRNNGHSVTVNTEKTAFGRWRFKNRKGYDYALSIHFNAYNGSATGTECYYKGTQKKASELASKVASVLGVRNRGAKATNSLYMMNIGFDNLLEVCFHDNSSDLNKYNSNINNVARAIATVITNGKVVSTVATTTKPSNSGYTGGSLVDYLKSIGVDSSFANRSKLAKANGISNYKGTASQNTSLLNKLRGGSATTVTSSSASYYPRYRGSSGSLVDALKNVGVNSSFSNRKAIANRNGIRAYVGTASQNTTLLSLLKQGKLKK